MSQPLVANTDTNIMIEMMKQNQEFKNLLVEQNANTALSVADHGILLALGKLIADRPASELRSDTSLRAAYLGY